MQPVLSDAEVAYQGDKLQEAVHLYQTVINAEPDQASAWHGLAKSFYRLGQYDDAVVSARQALKLDPQIADSYVILGVLLLHQGHPHESAAALQQAAQLQPDNKIIHEYLYLAYHRLGNKREVLRVAVMAFKKYPSIVAGLKVLMACEALYMYWCLLPMALLIFGSVGALQFLALPILLGVASYFTLTSVLVWLAFKEWKPGVSRMFIALLLVGWCFFARL